LGEPITIGRGAECDLRLPDGDVSRTHCRIEQSGSDYVVVDLASRNGTLIDGVRVSRRRLREGDVLRVGNCTLQFESASPAPRTLDDEVLEMLNDVAPSPAEELELVGVAVREGQPADDGETTTIRAAFASVSTVGPAPRPEPRAVKLFMGPFPTKSLWEKAVTTPAAVAPAAKPGVASESASWFRRRIPLPLAIGAAVVVAAGLFAMSSGMTLPRLSAPQPQKALPHSNPNNRD
jgi:predicted component of type VI protein secretion system